MTLKSLSTVAVIAAVVIAVPSFADAQGRRGGRAPGPRTAVRADRPRVVTVAPRSYYYRPYRPGVALGLYYGYPGLYAPYWYEPFGYRAYGYAPYGYGPYSYGPYRPGYYGGYDRGYYGRAYGGVRIDLPQRDAEVYADGYFLGEVDDFDGVMQQANLEPGPHRIEIRKPGFETIAFDVNVEPGRTIRYRAAMKPLP